MLLTQCAYTSVTDRVTFTVVVMLSSFESYCMVGAHFYSFLFTKIRKWQRRSFQFSLLYKTRSQQQGPVIIIVCGGEGVNLFVVSDSAQNAGYLITTAVSAAVSQSSVYSSKQQPAQAADDDP